jgi:hypothetical protein
MAQSDIGSEISKTKPQSRKGAKFREVFPNLSVSPSLRLHISYPTNIFIQLLIAIRRIASQNK